MQGNRSFARTRHTLNDERPGFLITDNPVLLPLDGGDNVLDATVKVYEMLGAEVFLYFDYEGSSMTARVDPRTTARTGDHVKFALDAEKIHVFDKETQVTITN
mgnify:CR=1 FL=1